MTRLTHYPAWMIALVTLLAVCASVSLSAPALAINPGPGWEATVRSLPTHLRPGGKGVIQVNVYNIGAKSSEGVATLTDVLPPGLTFNGVATGRYSAGDECSAAQVGGSTVVTCQVQPFLHTPVEYQPFALKVSVAPNASGTWTNHVTVAGGGAPTPAEVSDQITFSSAPAGFGFSAFDGWLTNADGTPDTQAGSHPYELTITFDLNTASTLQQESEEQFRPAGGEMRSIHVDLPPGFVGDPNAVPQCRRQEFDNEQHCPAASQVGLDTFVVGPFEKEGIYFEAPFFRTPVFDMVPPPGVPAQFAFEVDGNQVFLNAGVRSGGDYGISTHVDDIPQREIDFNSFTIWGVPGDPSHDSERGLCKYNGGGECPSGVAVKPLLTLPTSCGGLTFTGEVDAWENANTDKRQFESHGSEGGPVEVSGCDHLGFGPSISVAPDTSQADTPAGLTVEVKVPQEGLGTAEDVATSDIQDTKVVLPAGLVINPGQAAGLAACQAARTRGRHRRRRRRARTPRKSGRSRSRRRCLKARRKRNWKATSTSCSPTRRT